MSEKKTDVARYDRQIRLWGEDGQRALESAKICLINATATGTETLKNLVLPGIGSFTILDGNKVSEADLGKNFFVTISSVGRARAAVSCELLQELNYSDDPKVFAPVGSYVEKNPIEVIEKEIDFFKEFTHIIATDLPQPSLIKLSNFTYQHNIPLVIVRSYGFIGYLRLVVPEHTVIQSKLDNPPDDLRLAEPWSELISYASQFDVDKIEGGAHGHIPYLIILFDYLEKWKKSHDGKPPQTYPEKNEFKKLILSGQRIPEEENFPEAHRAAHKVFMKYEIPSEVQKILDDPKCNVDSKSSDFWILAAALKDFVKNQGQGKYLPLTGSIPDMTASTDLYIALQKVYQDKANKDMQYFTEHLRAHLKRIGKPENSMSEDLIRLFCKNARFLRVVRTSNCETELTSNTANSVIQTHLADPDSNLNWYVALLGVDRFFVKYNRLPGDKDSNVENDRKELKKVIADMLKERNIQNSIDGKYIDEIVRYGGAELHNIAAFMGGVASQEIIKLVTHQYVPLNSTFVLNGLKSTTIKEEL